MNNELNWAKQRADLLMKSVGFEGVERTEADDTVRDTIAAALQQVADECEVALWERVQREEYGHAKAAVTLDIEAIRARFPRKPDAELKEIEELAKGKP